MASRFIKARLNKDNFWNLIFLVFPIVLILMVQAIMDLIPGGVILLFATLILSPYLISRVNKVEYKNEMFHSSSTKRILCPYMPEAVGFILWLSIPFTAFWVLLLHDKAKYLDENMAIYNAIFWFIPTIYSILKNLPISIIFNKTAWTKGDGTTTDCYSSSNTHWNYNSHHNSSIHSSTQLESMLTSPSYTGLSCNIYHRK